MRMLYRDQIAVDGQLGEQRPDDLKKRIDEQQHQRNMTTSRYGFM